MNILFLHHNYPAQFRHIAEKLAQNPANTVVFLSEHRRKDIQIPGVQHFILQTEARQQAEGLELQEFNSHLGRSEAFANGLMALQKKGFKPDIIYDHPGWGGSLYVKDVFPDTPYVSFFEWFYTKDTDYSFWDNGMERPPSHFAKNRVRNLCQLNALSDCEAGIIPTKWQRSTYPDEFEGKLNVIHDGIDTDYFSPSANGRLDLPRIDLSGAAEIVTYVSRGLEPYRGFPQFFRSLPRILEKRKGCHVVIMGEDSVKYGSPRSDGKSYKEAMLEEVQVDPARVHFTGFRPYNEYLSLIRSSSVHVYLSAPFVLSWSMLEAMSCGALLVGSDTGPVQEIIADGENGFLVDFWDSKGLANKVIDVLRKRKKYTQICKQARQTILSNYDLKDLLPKHEQVLMNCIENYR
ncbi:MAG TPA: glycosyl transferase family 1 [Desulfovibrio sp.]|nr:glycosyl transferase family 1 [Desulfovibrio sp.]